MMENSAISALGGTAARPDAPRKHGGGARLPAIPNRPRFGSVRRLSGECRLRTVAKLLVFLDACIRRAARNDGRGVDWRKPIAPRSDAQRRVSTRLLPAAALLLIAHPARADAPAALCASAEKQVRADSALASQVAAVFGKAKFASTASDCLYPLKALRYASADVLIVQAGEPGEGCHGCGAPLSAYVIQRVGGGLKTVAKFREFAQLGSNGAVDDIWPIEIAGDDAVAIESGGMFQGYSSSHLDFFAFRAGALVDLEPKPQIVLDADNEGATADASKAITVQASWFFDPADKTQLVVDYKIEAKGATRVERVVWRLQDGKLVLTRGRVPPEVTEASGG